MTRYGTESAPHRAWLAPTDVVTGGERREHYLTQGLWNEDTLADRVTRHAAEHPDAVAVVDLGGDRANTYSDLERDADRVASHLAALGVRPGDIVAVQLPNWYETAVVDLAVLKAGGVLNSMLPIYRAKELRHMLNVGSVAVLVTPTTYRGHDYVAMVRALRGGVPALEHHIAIPDPAGDDWLATAALEAAEPAPRPAANAVSELIFTSGTEARPKAVMHTEQTTNFSVRSCWSTLGMTPEDVIWMPSPIGHSTGLNFGLRMALYHGLPLVLQDRWDAAAAASLIERHRCSYTLVATPFVKDLVEHARSCSCDLSSLNRLGCGGAPVPRELVAAAGRLGATTLRIYGSTEALVVTWNRPADPEAKRLETDGLPIDDVDIEVRSDDGRVLIGEPGEIYVRGPNTSVGFFADPERTAETYAADGWVRSGDLGVVDEQGYLAIVGRRKEIIIRGGLNIAPREVEDLIGTHPDVLEVAVVGVPDDRLGEIMCACVVPRGRTPLELNDIVDFCRDSGLATHKLPQRLLLRENLPRTASGKVQKYRLVEEAHRR